MNNKPKARSRKGDNDRQIPTAKERLSRLIGGEPRKPETSQKGATLHDPETRNSFVPGVVHVVLREGIDGRLIANRWADAKERAKFGRDFSFLRKLLKEHELVNIEATFDFTPPGLTPEKNPPAGRERYLTLYFKAHEDTRLISYKLRNTKLIEYAVPVSTLVPPRSPLNEPLMSRQVHGQGSQWYIERCNANSGWELKGAGQFFSGQGVVVADLDWGFYTGHQEFEDHLERTYNSITGGTYVNSNMGGTIYHGTAVLALLGAASNGRGMSGFAYGADLWAIQADDGQGHSPPFRSWLAAIDYVRLADSDNRPKVICLECETGDYGNIESDPAINQAIRDAIAAGVVVCVPAGNGNRDAGLDRCGDPITPTDSILVGATIFDADPAINRKCASSNWGPRIVVSAPGDPDNDITAGPDARDHYLHFGATSGATPKVAGTVALMLEANPQLTHAEIREILHSTGTPITDAGPTPIGTFLNTREAIREALRRAGVSRTAARPRPRKAAHRKHKKQNRIQPSAESRTIRSRRKYS